MTCYIHLMGEYWEKNENWLCKQTNKEEVPKRRKIFWQKNWNENPDKISESRSI